MSGGEGGDRQKEGRGRKGEEKQTKRRRKSEEVTGAGKIGDAKGKAEYEWKMMNRGEVGEKREEKNLQRKKGKGMGKEMKTKQKKEEEKTGRNSGIQRNV